MDNDYMITTADNPYCPFHQFEDWHQWDQFSGYHTLSYLASIARTSEDNSDEDNDLAIDEAISDILKLNITGNYIRVTRPTREMSKTA